MINYYTDSAKKSLWVLTNTDEWNTIPRSRKKILTCFSAENDSGFHIGQQVYNPQLNNSNWQPLSGEISVSEILDV